MGFRNVNISSICFSIIFCFCVWDIKYDIQSFEDTYNFYYVHYNSPLIFQLYVHFIVVILAIDLIYKIFKYANIVDVLTFLINIPVIYGFVTINVPNQIKIVELGLSNLENAKPHYEANKNCHINICGIIFISIILQLISGQNCCNSTSKSNNIATSNSNSEQIK